MSKGREALIALFDEVQRKCQDFSQELTFNVGNEQTRTAVCLYGSIIEYGATLSALAKLQRWIGFGPALRAMLEAYVDLRNVLKNKAHIRNMEVAFYDKRENIFREALTEKNDFLALIGQSPDANKQLQHCRDRLRDLRKQGFEVLRVKERFEKAGMLAEYRSVYSFLCNETHNDLAALYRRHIEEKNGKPSVIFFRDLKEHERIAELFEAVELSLFATEAIFQHCQGSLPQNYEPWKGRMLADFAKAIPDR